MERAQYSNRRQAVYQTGRQVSRGKIKCGNQKEQR